MSFLILLYAHLMADYVFQNDFIAKMKGKNLIILFTHAGLWTGTIALTGHLLGYDVGYVDISLLFVLHAFMDYLKANSIGIFKRLDGLKGGLLYDQLFHVLQIIVFMQMN